IEEGWALVGMPFGSLDQLSEPETGVMCVYDLDQGGEWNTYAVFEPENFSNFKFGWSVAMTDQFVLISALGSGQIPGQAFFYDRSAPPSFSVEDYTVTVGTAVSGGVEELQESDDEYARARSVFGFTALEPNVVYTHTDVIAPCPV